MSLLDTASLIVTPNGYKEGKLYSVIPSDGSGDMSVVRATTATRVNSAGLVELVPYNLVQYSEDFTNAAWTKTAINVTSSAIPNPITETLNAQDLIPTATLSAHRILQLTGEINSVNTWSVYAKSKGYNFITIVENGNTAAKVSFNLSTGSVATETIAVGQIDSLGNGWYRCAMIHTTTSTPRFDIYVSPTDSINSYTADGTSGVTLFGAQAVEGSTALPYQKTETRLNIPRLDYSNGTCPSLLVEPQRTNLLTYSSSFDNAAWTKGDSSISANNIASPSGVQDADLLTENTANNAHVIYRSVTGTSNTFSFYAKPNGRNWLGVLSNNGDVTFFNIANGTLGTIAATSTATIEDAGNGWYRCTVYNTHPTFGASIYLSTGNGITDYLGNGTSGVYIWGAQLEAGSYSTSFIPTTSASVTRNADVISKTGISSLIGQTEGVMFIDYNYDAKPDTNGNLPMVIYDGSNEAYIFITGGGSVRLELYNGGVLQGSIAGSIGAVGRKKIAFGYKQNDFVGYMNGVQIATDNNGTVGAMSNLYVGSYYTASYNANGGINAAALWQTRLTNAQLATLTTI